MQGLPPVDVDAVEEEEDESDEDEELCEAEDVVVTDEAVAPPCPDCL